MSHTVRFVRVSICLLVAQMVCTSVSAQTPWPDFMPYLQPQISASPVVTPLPDDLLIVTPADDVFAERALWSGTWSGWAGRDLVIDTKLVVEKLSGDEATIVVGRALEGADPFVERLRARFEDGELRATLSTGTKLSYRMRNPDSIELHWLGASGGWMAGIVSKIDPNSTTLVERIPTPFNEEGTDITLKAVVHKPAGSGPFPTLVFNHGSSGFERNPASVRYTATSPVVARFFTQRGWLVVFPQRRGRGGSDGSYAEGLNKAGVAYSTSPRRSLKGLTRALDDVDAVMAWLKNDPRVNVSNIVMGGVSRGGILSIVYAGTRPESVMGVINFVGGWIDERAKKVDIINRASFVRGASFKKPTLWLYADNDPFYSLQHSRSNFDAFVDAGGTGTFFEAPVQSTENGHTIASSSAGWTHVVNDYLNTLDSKN